MKTTNNLSNLPFLSSISSLIISPYQEGYYHFNKALNLKPNIFPDAQRNLQDNTFPLMTARNRTVNFFAGVILWTPVVNIIAKVAMHRLFPSTSISYEKPPNWKRVNHIVVLMLENRSFDNLVGRLYPKSAQYNGLDGQENNSYQDKDGVNHIIKTWDSRGVRMDTPNPDPGEEFKDMTYQLFENHLPSLATLPTMSGFAQNYYDFICNDETAQKELRKKRGLKEMGKEVQKPTEDEVADIMHCYSPERVPVISQLARSFAISDMYHASAPNQTWPNRFFVHTSTANGYENNSPVHFPYTMKTIFTRFNDLGRNKEWKIYFHDIPHSATLSDLWPHPASFKTFDHFLDDAHKGRLPSYSFIEPRFYQEAQFPSDQHPPHDVRHGEQLMAEVYNALRKSPQWKETLLVITYDEHGGCYDHQPPPSAVPPEPPRENQKFAFDRYGVRVPAVFVSPLIAPQTILRPPVDAKAPVFDHTSVNTSVRNCFGLGPPLTARDAVAPDFSNVLNMPEGKYNMGPEEIIAPPAPMTTLQEAEGKNMNALQKSLHEMSKHLPDNTKLQKDENYLINSVKKINQLLVNRLAVNRSLDVETGVDLLTGRKEALANFANFRAKPV